MPTLLAQAMVESSLTYLFTDHTFADDNLCSSIINDHPCVKNILTVLVNHISDNIREIEIVKERNYETYEILFNQLRKNQYEIKLLKAELKQMKINTYVETNSKARDSNLDRKPHLLHTTSQNKEKLGLLNGVEKKQNIGNSTLVSDFVSNFL